VEAVRSADHQHPITSHAAAPALFTSPTDGYGEPDDWKMAAAADFFGTSLYAKHAESARPWPYWMLAAGLDFERSAGHSFDKGFWIGELQAGQGVTGMRIALPVTAHDERYWMWQVISHGAREIAVYAWYPMSSGFESGGYGLINLDGALTDRAKAAGATAQVIERNAAEINSSRPAAAQVAVLYDRLSYMVGGTEPSLSKLGNAERDSLMGIYRAFYEAQIPVDFVHPDAVERDRLSQYRILFLPYAVMLSSRVAEEVKQYVAQGGVAVAEARLAWNNARGYASLIIPGFGLDRVFGAREELIRPDANPRLIIQPAAGLPGLKAEDSVDTASFEEDLQPLGQAQVVARFPDGKVAMVRTRYGRGAAILIGSFAALSYQRKHDPSTQRLFLSLARLAGVTREVRVSGTGTSEVEVRRLTSRLEQFLFVFNHATSAADTTISLRLPWRPKSAQDLIQDQSVRFRMDGPETVLHRNLVPDAIWVVRLARD
jgi:beta-galactosidase